MTPRQMLETFRINRNILECKGFTELKWAIHRLGINRNILECK